MDKFKELEYIPQIGLVGLKRTGSGYNFRCPICGDSKRSKSKQRGWILTNKEFLTCYCFNCNFPPMSLKKFIEQVNPSLYEEFIKEEKNEYKNKLKNGELFSKKVFTKPITSTPVIYPSDETFKYGLEYVFTPSKYFVPASNSRECIAYAKKRKIPKSVFDKLYYSTHPQFINNKLIIYSNMMIFPLWYDFKRWYGFQGRATGRQKLFYNFSPNEEFKVSNFFNIDTEKRVFIFESIIDSLYTPNSIANLGSSLSKNVQDLIPNRVWCFDNDMMTSDKKGLKMALQKAEEGEYVHIWPSHLDHIKDINELVVKNNLTSSSVFAMIKENIYSGLEAKAKLKFKLMRK